jgi:hypothetical protein
LERNVKTGACLGCLAHYAREYADKFAGESSHSFRVADEYVPLVEQFVSLISVLRARGAQMPIVPTPDEVGPVNTLIKMSRPAAGAPPAPPVQQAQPAPVIDPRHAMWVRIHGREIADQMLEAGL